MTTHTASPVTTLAAAIESRDPRAILRHYAEDATVVVLDRDHPPTTPQKITGRAAIGDYYREVCARNIEHQVREAVSTSTGLAYTQHCRYPEGARVVCATVATLRDGLIVQQTAVQAWDET